MAELMAFAELMGAGALLTVYAFGILVTVLPFWMICKKAGFSPALSLLILIPVVDIILLFYLAFAEWPALKRLD